MIIKVPDHIIHFRPAKDLGYRACRIFKNNPFSVRGWMRALTLESDFDHNPWSCELVELIDRRDSLHHVLPFIELLAGIVSVGDVRQRITVSIDLHLVSIREGKFIPR